MDYKALSKLEKKTVCLYLRIKGKSQGQKCFILGSKFNTWNDFCLYHQSHWDKAMNNSKLTNIFAHQRLQKCVPVKAYGKI